MTLTKPKGGKNNLLIATDVIKKAMHGKDWWQRAETLESLRTKIYAKRTKKK